MMLVRKALFAFFIGSIVLLSACTEDKQNPLTRKQDTASKAAAAGFLFDISQQAITRLKQTEPDSYKKKSYQYCMNDPTGFNSTHAELQACDRLFAEMESIVHEQKSPYKKATKLDISDQTMWTLLASYYVSNWNK